MWGFLPDMMHNCSQANAYFLIISDGKYPEFQHFLYENIRFSSGGSGRVFRLVRRTIRRQAVLRRGRPFSYTFSTVFLTPQSQQSQQEL